MEQPQKKEKITPQQEITDLKEQVAASPERAKDIISSHLERRAEDVYQAGFSPSPEKFAQLEQQLLDPHYKEKEKAIEKIFAIANDHGLINAVRAAQKAKHPALLDEFHDRVIKYIHENEVD